MLYRFLKPNNSFRYFSIVQVYILIKNNENKQFSDTLLGVGAAEYGENYASHVLQMYQLYLEMADRISTRREKANTFFLTLNTGMIAFLGYLVGVGQLSYSQSWLSFVSISGIVICYLWHKIIRSYRNLNTAKFKVIHEIERLLPLKPYDAEWEYVGRGVKPKLYVPLTHVEAAIPLVFLILHLSVMIWLVLND